MSKRAQAGYESGERSPRGDYLEAAASIGVDVLFVITGSNAVGEQSASYAISPPSQIGDDVRVPLYDVEGAAGAGRSLEQETVIGHFPLTAAMVAQLALDDARLAGVRVRGDSMEPTLFDGDWTFVNLDDTNWTPGGVFLIWVSGELRIKRVQRLAGGAMLLISDNSHYQPEMIPSDRMQEVAVLGRIKTRLGDIA